MRRLLYHRLMVTLLEGARRKFTEEEIRTIRDFISVTEEDVSLVTDFEIVETEVMEEDEEEG